MLKNIKILFFLMLSSLLFSNSVSPVLGIRFNDVLSSNDLQNPTHALGLKMKLEGDIYSGFDVSDGDFRIFIERPNIIFGLGTNSLSQPQFTVGGTYTAFGNLGVHLEYVLNQLTDADGDGPNEDPFEDQLRISLNVQF